jgi:hypothetical protein
MAPMCSPPLQYGFLIVIMVSCLNTDFFAVLACCSCIGRAAWWLARAPLF